MKKKHKRGVPGYNYSLYKASPFVLPVVVYREQWR